MPELPEVETVVRELRPLIVGKTIDRVEAIWQKTFVDQAGLSLSGQIIQKIDRRGKFIILVLNRSYLIVHFRMTGRLSLSNGQGDLSDLPHLRCLIQFKDGSRLLFEDMRKFGRIYHVKEVEEVLKNVGIDALDTHLTFEHFYDYLKNRKMGVKAFLMSQKWIAGLGNIYTDESLFLAKIHPEQTCDQISPGQGRKLFTAVQEILHRAVENMGSTISDYRDAYGNPGRNQLYFKVYRRAGKPCFACGALIEKKKVAGRGTHFCPQCQKLRGSK
ncbi:DNA-formamidopyrimidine glycosylase [Caldithrix abyssi]